VSPVRARQPARGALLRRVRDPLARVCPNLRDGPVGLSQVSATPARILLPPSQACRRSPDSYTPKHLAEKILTSKTALEDERKQVTVLFADLKGSMELLADRDPEEARSPPRIPARQSRFLTFGLGGDRTSSSAAAFG
jgi:hypothetical protein